jgi:molecular chaperone HscB
MNSPLFCGNCHTLQPPEGRNFFELFSLAPAYDVSVEDLRRRYLQCSRDIHPDRHGGTDEEREALSLRASAWLNEAYRVLSDPVLRAGYLLELSGGDSSAENKSVPQEVLTQTLVLREEMEEAVAAGDEGGLARCGQEARRLHDEAVLGIAELARRLPGTPQDRQELRQRLNTAKYYQKLVDKL